MRTGSVALRNYLTSAAGVQGCMAECLTLVLSRYLGVDAARGMTQDGATGNTKCQWTLADLDINGFYTSPGAPAITRRQSRQTMGTEVAELSLSLGGAGWAFPNGKSLMMAAVEGAFDGASVKLERLIMPTWGDLSLGSLNWFEGSVGTIEPSTFGLSLTVKSGMERLSQPFPRRLFQPACPHALYSAACGLARTLNTNYWTGTVLASPAPTQQAFSVGGTHTLDRYKLGTIKVTGPSNSPNLGLVRTISASGTTGLLTLAVPLPIAPVAGDTIQYDLGCDKLLTTCQGKSNDSNFGGFPFVPRPESIR